MNAAVVHYVRLDTSGKGLRSGISFRSSHFLTKSRAHECLFAFVILIVNENEKRTYLECWCWDEKATRRLVERPRE
jgi:hypothetical protein